MNIEDFKLLIAQNPVLWFCAISGTVIFLIQFILNLFIGDHEHHAEVGSEDNGEGDLKWLSKYAVSGFLMMFGWIGLTCVKQFALPLWVAIVVAILSGFFTVFLLRLLFRGVRRLHSPGNVFNIEDAIGREGEITHRIPENGVGSISLLIDNFRYEIGAISTGNKELPSFTRVKVIDKTIDNIAVVIPL